MNPNEPLPYDPAAMTPFGPASKLDPNPNEVNIPKIDPEELATKIDFACLKPTASIWDIKDACALVEKHNMRSICVAPINVSFAADHAESVSVAVGYPHGTNLRMIKLHEGRIAIEQGARELDIVLNYGRYLGGDREILTGEGGELPLLVDLCHSRNAVLKIILEAVYWDSHQLSEIAHKAAREGVDYVKTGTGYANQDMTHPGNVKLLVEATKGTRCGVKAAGGIHTYGQACHLLACGASIVGTSHISVLDPGAKQ